MANEFIIRKGYKSLSDSQITGSLSVSNAVTASFFTGSFRGDGSELTGIDGFPFTGSASISGSLTIVGPVTATEFIGNGSQLTGIEGFPYTGSAIISGSLQVTGSISTDTDAIINTLTVGRGGGNLDTNTVLGYEALISNVGGEYNVAVGYKALSSSLADMGPNTAVGRGALQNNVYGFRNTAIGNASLFSNTLGDFNTAVGNTALVNNTEGNENIAIGDGTLNDNIGGDYNTGVGTFALHSNTGGNNNTAIGHSSLYNNITGSNNTAIGTDAGQYAGASVTSLTSVDNSIFIGYQSRALNAVGDTNEIVIGHNVVGLGSNTTVIGNNNTVSTTLKGAVSASLFSGSFVGDGSQLTGIADPTPITATINNTNSPFTITSQSIVIVDSTNGNVTINLPDLDAVVGTPNQKPILIYKNDYSQNVIFVSPSGSQLINGSDQDVIVSIQIGIVYNPTSAGWVTEGNSYQSLAELELFFVPKTETGSLSVATASYVEYADVVNKPTLVSGSSQISFSGITNKPTLVSGSSQISFSGITNKPTLVSGSSQISFSGITNKPSGIVSSSVQVKEYNVFATTGSNQFNGNQSITGSLTVSGQVVAQTLNVQQVTSSIVYSSGSNIFGNTSGNTQQFTGSLQVTGSSHYVLGNIGIGETSPAVKLHIVGTTQMRLNTTSSGSIIQFWKDSNASFAGAIGNAMPGSSLTNDLLFSTYNGSLWSERLRITSGGNVGIGSDSPQRQLVVSNGGANGIEIASNISGLSEIISYNRSTAAYTPLNFVSSKFTFETGNVGIGLSSPDSKFEVRGSTSSPQFRISRSEQTSQGLTVQAGGGVTVFDSYEGTNTVFGSYTFNSTKGTTTSTRMRIDGSGNVGIGIDSPGARLQVRGANEISTFFDAQNEGASGATFARIGDSYPFNKFTFSNGYIDVGGSFQNYPVSIEARSGGGQLALTRSGAVAEFYMGGTTGGGTQLYIRSGGSGGVRLDTGATSWVSASDLRLKDIEKPIENAVESLSTLQTVYYSWKNSDNKSLHLGLIAQEVEAVFPEIVSESSIDEMKGVTYTELIPVLVKAIQEQQSQIETLKAEIQTLKQ